MKKLMRKSSVLCVCFTLLFSGGCTSSEQEGEKVVSENESFTLFLDDMVVNLLDPSSTDINALFLYPEEIGLESDLYSLSYYTKEEYESSCEDAKEYLEQLHEFDYDALNDEQQIAYAVMEDTLEGIVEQSDMYYLTSNYFDVSSGVPQSLPMSLYFFNINTQKDLDSFISILTSTPTYFKQYVQHEIDRQNAGYGLSQLYMNDVIEKVQTFVNGQHTYITDSAYEKIDALDFLDETQKTEYKAQVDNAFQTSFIPAYSTLLTDLQAIEILVEDEGAGLADYENGIDYYEMIVEDDSGFTSIDEYRAYLLEKQEQYIGELQIMLFANMDLMDVDFEAIPYTSLTSIEALMEYFNEKVSESGNYPESSGLRYEMEILPASMQDIVTFEAAYFLSPLDSMDAKEKLVLNGDFSANSYNTVAHEGYPGHMYQYNYFKQSDAHLSRKLFSNLGYMEAWAMYSADDMNQYADDVEVAEFISLNNLLTYTFVLEIDLMIHYDNAPQQDVLDYIMTNFGLTQEEAMETYEQLLFSPGVFIPYYGYYYRLLDLKDEFMDESQENSERAFNELFLDLGPVPYAILEEQVNEVIGG